VIKLITPLDQTIRGVMEFTWPMIIICVLIVSSIRITYLIRNHEKIVFYREILSLFFMIYILCLFQIVTFEDQTIIVGNNNFNLIPFKEILRYEFGSRLFFKNVIGNLVMFVPYGFFVSYFTKSDKTSVSFFLILFASLSIEFTQLAIGRIFDIDDVLLNVVGGILGYLLYIAVSAVNRHLPDMFRSDWFYNLICLGLIMLFGIYIFGYWGVIF